MKARRHPDEDAPRHFFSGDAEPQGGFVINRKLAAVSFLVLSGIALPVAAQSPSVAALPSVLEHGAALRLAVESPAEAAELGNALPYSSGRRHQGTVLMIVGAAGIITGLIIDEDIVTVAGAVLGGVGLYMFLDSGGKVEVGASRSIPIGF